MTDSELFTVDEAAPMLRLSASGLRRLLARGDVSGVKIGKRWCVSGSEIERIKAEGTQPVVLAGGRQVSREAISAAVPDDGSPGGPVALAGGRLLYPGGPAVMGDRDITRSHHRIDRIMG
jgi:excisionase family DNA binding protein